MIREGLGLNMFKFVKCMDLVVVVTYIYSVQTGLIHSMLV